MIYDCFIFNSELDLLKLRLAFMNSMVDYFVICESGRTLSGEKKPLHFKEHEKEFEEYLPKIIHLEAPSRPDLTAWDYEYFQRNYIKEGLKQCKDDDLILISDVDEIINLKNIVRLNGLKLPALIELSYYYYFFNLKAGSTFTLNLLSNYSFIKNFNIGIRNPDYKEKVKNVIKKKSCVTGWHFSYLFGLDIEKYKTKVKSFSHQEYNTSYYLDDNRIKKCIETGIDLFERENIFFSFKKPEKELKEILPFIRQLGLEHYIHTKQKLSFSHLKHPGFIIKKKLLPFIKNELYTRPRYNLIVFTSPFRKKIRKLIFQ